jgi:ABC-type transporter Mla subunit MlaD
MTRNTNYFKLGLFVILSFGLAVGFLIAFGAGQFMTKEMLAESSFDESVQGLDVGSEVKYKGVRIGTVKSITTPAKVYGIPSNYVLVIFTLDPDVFVGSNTKDPEQAARAAIENGLTIYLSFKGLTGAAYLETDYFPDAVSGQDITWQPKHLYIPSRKSNIKRFGDALNLILENLSEMNILGMVATLEELLKTLNNKTTEFDLVGISEQTSNLLQELRKTNRQLSDTLGSEEFHQMIQDARGSFGGIRDMVDKAAKPVDKTLEDLMHTAANARALTRDLETRTDTGLKQVSGQIDTLLDSLNTTVKMLETMVWLNTDTINKTLDNFERTSENLKQLSIEIKHYPGRLLFERPPKKMSDENIKGEK